MLTNYDFPLKYLDKNLIYNTNGEVWATFELGGFSYDFLSYETKIATLERIAHLVCNIDTQAKIFIYPIGRQVNHQFATLRKEVKGNEIEHAATQYYNNIESFITQKIEERGNINDYQFFIVIKLKNALLEKNMKEMVKDIPRAINTVLNISTDHIRKDEIAVYRESSRNMLRKLRQHISAIEATPEQTQWMLTRMMTRGLGKKAGIRRNNNKTPWKPPHTVGTSMGADVIYPYTDSLRTLFDGGIVPSKKFIKVETEEGDSWQTFLQFSHIPDGIAFPGGEYLKILYDFSIASEICITIKPTEFKKAMDKIERQSKKIAGQVEHTVNSGENVPDDLQDSYIQVQELERNLKQNRDPLLETTITICLSGTSTDEVNKAVSTIRTYYKDNQYRLARSTQDQLMCFYQFIPGTPIYNSDYKFQLPPKTLAASMFLAKKELGDTKGPYIGTVGIVEKPVYFTPFLATASEYNRSPACFFMGTLGGGKSFNSNLLLYLAIMQGARALIVDPKSERGMWETELPELAPYMTTTTLSSSDADRGKLDPFNIYRNELNNPEKLDEAADIARNIIMELYNIKSGEPTAILLTEVINKMKRGIRGKNGVIPPSMELIYKLLLNTPKNDEWYKQATLLARSMRATKELGMSKLLFGTGRERGLSFNTKINILQIDGLNMPDPTLLKDEYNQSQKLSTVLMIPIASFAKKFASQNRTEKKVILLDESWALRQTTEGKNLFNYLARTGRSLNCCTIFIGHSVKDVDDEGLKAAITFKFCFKVNTSEEAKNSLEFMELEITDENIKTVMNMPNGCALFRDLNGNVDILKFDAVDEHIIFAFRTDTSKYKRR